MVIDVITIFPEMFDGPMTTSIIGSARERGLLELRMHDLREHTLDRHRTTDDYPYGGGPGMVMKPEPLLSAIREAKAAGPGDALVAILTPRGRPLDQAQAQELSAVDRLVLVCGRYEGIDERVFAAADMTISIGDYVLTGGELLAMVVIDAITRLLPGVLGDDASSVEESFTGGLLEYPQYTRPSTYEGMTVPDVLLSGNHAAIAAYRRTEAIRTTARMRPDLLEAAPLSDDERRLADEARKEIDRD